MPSSTTSRTPYKLQFRTPLVKTSPIGAVIPVAYDIRSVLPEAAEARSFVSQYTIRLAASAISDQDVIDGKKLATVRLDWSDGSATFPVGTDRHGGSGDVDISMTLSLAAASASQLMRFTLDDALPQGTTADLLWSVTEF